MINAADEYFSSPMITVQGFEIMVFWFSENLPAKTRIVFSESGFTFDKIVLEFLKHYVENSNVDPDADRKLMLMNNHGSHLIREFIALANDNHICPYSLISHLTHCMQLLDVETF